MTDTEEEVIPGLTLADMKKIADQILEKTDVNHPQSSKPGNKFLDILDDEKADISAASVFVRKISL